MSEANAHERVAMRRAWLRMTIETLAERSLTTDTVRPPRAEERIVRFVPYWRSRSDEELAVMAAHLKRYCRASDLAYDADELEDGTDDTADDSADHGE